VSATLPGRDVARRGPNNGGNVRRRAIPTGEPSGAASGSAGMAEQSEPAGRANERSSALCITAGTQLCDGFEGGKIDIGTWKTPTRPEPTVAVDTSRPHRGKYSLHIHALQMRTTWSACRISKLSG